MNITSARSWSAEWNRIELTIDLTDTPSDSLADFITAVKEDKAVSVIEKEFFDRASNPSDV